eukprot:GHVT01029039.1.p1 GENE.GHVT01029039.1~~GHVT01029039.1.p1  ORF type:complete len:123 (-),score=22.13 GHVT01029039.1:487-855(-)
MFAAVGGPRALGAHSAPGGTEGAALAVWLELFHTGAAGYSVWVEGRVDGAVHVASRRGDWSAGRSSALQAVARAPLGPCGLAGVAAPRSVVSLADILVRTDARCFCEPVAAGRRRAFEIRSF